MYKTCSPVMYQLRVRTAGDSKQLGHNKPFLRCWLPWHPGCVKKNKKILSSLVVTSQGTTVLFSFVVVVVF